MTMTSSTPAALRLPLRIIADGTDRLAWLDGRGEGVTASQVHAIASGGRATWQRILEEKLNGEKFKGNAETNRGHVREPFLLAYAADNFANVEPSSALYAHPEHDLHRATPDGLGYTDDGELCGVEAKSHAFGWDRDDVPPEHYDQCQWGMHVTGATCWLYIWEVMGEDGEPTLDAPWRRWIKRDERRIARLVKEADAFLAWRAAGAPATDDLPAELDDALAQWADARARKRDAETDEKAAEAIIRAHIVATPGAETDGLKLAGRAAQFVYTVTEKDTLDADAWAEAEPASHSGWIDLKMRADTAAAIATDLYHKPSRSTRLNITPTKETA